MDNTATPADFVGFLFFLREYAHRQHLKVTGPGSFAAHQALGEFYEAIVGQADEFAEVCQGLHGDLLDIPLFTDDLGSEEKPAVFLRSALEWINENRDDFTQTDSTLQNITDDIRATFARTLYKLDNLA